MKSWMRVMLAGTSGLATFAVTATAFAHVVVTPAQSTVAKWEQYTMRVPCEKTDPTTKVVLKIPAGVEFEQYEPVAGWSVHTQKIAGGAETVTWQTKGAGIQPGQFMQFSFIAENPAKPTTIDWDAFQTYKDGTIVEWTGDENSATPHSMTQILSSQPVAAGNAAATTNQTPVASAPVVSNGLNWSMADTWVLTVAIVAILLSGLALVFSLRSSRDKP